MDRCLLRSSITLQPCRGLRQAAASHQSWPTIRGRKGGSPTSVTSLAFSVFPESIANLTVFVEFTSETSCNMSHSLACESLVARPIRSPATTMQQRPALCLCRAPDRPQFPARSLSACRWQQGGSQLKFVAQRGELPVSTLKKDGSLPISGVVVIDQRSELFDVCTQSDVLGAAAHDGLPSLCLRGLGAVALMVAKLFENRGVIAKERVSRHSG